MSDHEDNRSEDDDVEEAEEEEDAAEEEEVAKPAKKKAAKGDGESKKPKKSSKAASVRKLEDYFDQESRAVAAQMEDSMPAIPDNEELENAERRKSNKSGSANGGSAPQSTHSKSSSKGSATDGKSKRPARPKMSTAEVQAPIIREEGGATKLLSLNSTGKVDLQGLDAKKAEYFANEAESAKRLAVHRSQLLELLTIFRASTRSAFGATYLPYLRHIFAIKWRGQSGLHLAAQTTTHKPRPTLRMP